MTIPVFKKINIQAYKPGKSNLRKIKKIIKLSANESALGASSKVKKNFIKKKFIFLDIQIANLKN